MTRNAKIAIAGGAVLAVLAFLAFGVFGIHTAFIDDEVSEDNPFSEIATADDPATDGPEPVGDAVDPDANAGDAESGEAGDPVGTGESGSSEVQTIASNNGVLVNHGHEGVGTANVITDGDRTFLRFEDDFAIDNGPDLNVYLVRGVDANGDSGLFDDDFIDLGDLKGNIGAQNYEIPVGTDITEYDTVVIWCVRFGVAFNAADLA